MFSDAELSLGIRIERNEMLTTFDNLLSEVEKMQRDETAGALVKLVNHEIDRITSCLESYLGNVIREGLITDDDPRVDQAEELVAWLNSQKDKLT